MGTFGKKLASSAPPKRLLESGVRQLADIPKLWSDEDSPPSETTAATARLVVSRTTLTIVAGLRAGEVVPVPDKHEIYIGRDRANDIRVTDDGVSRIHCRLTRDGDDFVVQDLGSTNGTKVNGAPVGTERLAYGDRISLGPFAVLQLNSSTESEDNVARRLYASATRDPLTHTFKRAYLLERLGTEIAYAKRHGTGLAMMLIDVDGLEAHNKRHGQRAGDAVLREIAREIGSSVRTEDVFARYGGDEFAVLLRTNEPGSTHRLAERIRQKVEALRVSIVGGTAVTPTISIGVAQLSDPLAGDTGDSLSALADRQLYRAKLLGRNRVSGG
jgi:two-component system cell cycle response regulator